MYIELSVSRQDASDYRPHMYLSPWASVELLEAATRAGLSAAAEAALERVLEATAHVPNDAAQGIAARSRALLRPELARAHLLYGEWLRRKGRRVDAREHLRAAHDQLTTIGMEAFARTGPSRAAGDG